LQELKKYIDSAWPSYFITDKKNLVSGLMENFDSETQAASINGDFLRYLLARYYYPDSILSVFDDYCRNIAKAENKKLAPKERASAYLEAAKIARHMGMELFGTELGPDWFCHGGDFEKGPSLSTRTNGTSYANASSDEIMRAEKHIPEPNTRFHYRYNAAELAWKAAELMPDNSSDTAKILCIAGSWIKSRDPGRADKFYKALVRRCPNTILGAEANRKHWFPEIDENGDMTTIKNSNEKP
jgi:hypothetical protein